MNWDKHHEIAQTVLQLQLLDFEAVSEILRELGTRAAEGEEVPVELWHQAGWISEHNFHRVVEMLGEPTEAYDDGSTAQVEALQDEEDEPGAVADTIRDDDSVGVVEGQDQHTGDRPVEPSVGVADTVRDGEGVGVAELLRAIVERVPPPEGDPDAPLRALIFDSVYDPYLGAIPSVRVVDGVLEPGMQVTFGARDEVYEVDQVGYQRLKRNPVNRLGPGEVGYAVAGIKEVSHTRVGDTILDARNRAQEMLPGYQEVQPMVFAGLYPTESDQYEELRDALDRLRLNDASLHFEPEASEALGFGFRCGFLGLLHMEIVQERLSREFGVDLITTVPNVKYWVRRTDGEAVEVETPTKLPDPAEIEAVEEPIVRARIFCPAEFIGNVQKLCHDRRGIFQGMHYPDPQRVELDYELPLAEVVLDFYDRLKSGTRGYAGLDYEFHEYRPDDLVKLDILVNHEPVDAFSVIIHRDKAEQYGRHLLKRLQELIPRQQFQVALQASIGQRIVARENIRPMRKNVTAKCYGGDITRKRKLLEKQREGKRRMKSVGQVEIPQEAFLAVLSLDED